jgi:glycerol uptake facilitator-like aquaporin
VSGWLFTSSSIFCNPAITTSRIFTNTYSGIEPISAGFYVIFQILGMMVGWLLVNSIYPIDG